MFDMFIFVALPYAAILSLIFGSVIRFKVREFSYSSLSTQFLENRWLAWASMPWHFGIGLILLGHLLAFVFPGTWSSLVSIPVFLMMVETLGVLCAFLCIFGLFILLIRRFVDAKLQAVTSYMDVAALLILLFQVSTGLAIALLHPWGSAWAPGALGPYLQSILLFQPDASFLREMPPFVKLHVASAWILLLFFPFTRLVHVLSLPLRYFVRAPQKVVWNSSRAQSRFEKIIKFDNERRLFLKAAMGTAASISLLSMGALDKFLRYFMKQDLTEPEEAHLLTKKLQRLKQTAEERELELERMSQDSIFVARLSELERLRGKYFIDYEMKPALAFRDDKGFPIVISAKCTHLGCTVGQNVDEQGRILCPCHISYFDIRTGKPNAGSPAKDPLPRLGWALKDENGKLIMTQDSQGRREGLADASKIENSRLYIMKFLS